MLTDYATTALTTLLVTLDPVALAPIFAGLTRAMQPSQRRQVAWRASLIAFGVLAFFALGGEALLRLLGVGLPAFRIAGGILLFWIAFEIVFERRTERKPQTAEVAITQDHIRHIAAFPLGVPLLAGPGAITAVILLSGRADSDVGRLALLIVLIGVGVACCLAVFLAAEPVARLLGITGNVVLTRLLGVILAALAVQFVVGGIAAL